MEKTCVRKKFIPVSYTHLERDLILFMDLVLLGKCSEVWVFGSEITDGMKLEIGKAKKRRMTVRYFTEDLKEA